jgi:hypothetical protein
MSRDGPRVSRHAELEEVEGEEKTRIRYKDEERCNWGGREVMMIDSREGWRRERERDKGGRHGSCREERSKKGEEEEEERERKKG